MRVVKWAYHSVGRVLQDRLDKRGLPHPRRAVHDHPAETPDAFLVTFHVTSEAGGVGAIG